MRFTEYDHAVEAVPSQNPLGLRKNLVILRRICVRNHQDSAADEVLSRRSRRFRLSATPQDRDRLRAQPRLWRLMAGKTTEVTPQKEEVPEKEGPETPPDSPLLDLSDAAIKKLRPFGIIRPGPYGQPRRAR